MATIHPLTTAITEYLSVSNRDLKVLSGREGRLVCRVSRPGGDVLAKADLEPGAFDREARAMEQLRALGLPVSEVVEIKSGPPALLAATWAEGKPVSATSPNQTLAEIGRILRTIHSAPASPPFSGHPSIHAWIEGWLRSLLPWWQATAGLPATEEAQVEAWLNDVQPLLARRAGTLILFDGRPDHFLADEDGHVRMIDVADLMPGDPVMDLAVLELDAPGVLAAVLEGYAPSPDEAEEIRQLVPLYAFLRALSAAEWLTTVQHDESAARPYLDAAARLGRL